MQFTLWWQSMRHSHVWIWKYRQIHRKVETQSHRPNEVLDSTVAGPPKIDHGSVLSLPLR